MNATSRPPAATDQRPWYREPWPWVLIAIPAITVVASAVTLWLALTHPDRLVVDDSEYQQLRSGLQAAPVGEPRAEDDGDR